jgi:hypothetical protein
MNERFFESEFVWLLQKPGQTAAGQAGFGWLFRISGEIGVD